VKAAPEAPLWCGGPSSPHEEHYLHVDACGSGNMVTMWVLHGRGGSVMCWALRHPLSPL